VRQETSRRRPDGLLVSLYRILLDHHLLQSVGFQDRTVLVNGHLLGSAVESLLDDDATCGKPGSMRVQNRVRDVMDVFMAYAVLVR
jgi:hypothetical protein